MAEEAKVEEEPKEVEETVGMAILGDLVKAFQVYLDDREWRSVRYCVSCKSSGAWRGTDAIPPRSSSLRTSRPSLCPSSTLPRSSPSSRRSRPSSTSLDSVPPEETSAFVSSSKRCSGSVLGSLERRICEMVFSDISLEGGSRVSSLAREMLDLSTRM